MGRSVRRADFMMVLAYATDLATGQSRDFALRSCVLAMRLAERTGQDVETRREVFHQAILRYIGCNADSHLLTAHFGGEIARGQDLALADMGSQTEIGAIFVNAFTRVFGGMAPDALRRAVQEGLADAVQVSIPILSGHCEVAQRIGRRIGLEVAMLGNLGQLYERWDGRGLPRGRAGTRRWSRRSGAAAAAPTRPNWPTCSSPTPRPWSRGSTRRSGARRSWRWSLCRMPVRTRPAARRPGWPSPT